MLWRPAYHRLIVQVADGLTTLVSFLAAYYLWETIRKFFPTLPLGSAISIEDIYLVLMGCAAVIWVVLFHYFDAYAYQRFTSFATEFKIILKTVALGTLSLVLLHFLLRIGYVPRSMIGLFVIVNIVFLTLEKMFLFAVAQALRRRGMDRKTVLIVGTGDQTHRFMEALEENFSWGLDIIGFLDVDGERVGQQLFDKPILGGFADIIPVLRAYSLDEVIITVSTRRLGEIRAVLEACEQEGIQVRIISNFLGDIAKKIRADVVYGLSVVSISYIPENQLALMVKRGMDIVFSLAALICAAPLMFVTALAVKLSSPGPVFFRYQVIGFNKKPFFTWKFRTMVKDAEVLKEKLLHLNEMDGPVFKIKNDPRITPIGSFLRRYSLDELPQLWSVLKGDLSLVGPRAPGPHEVKRFESWHRRKLSIKPGLTCLWQVNGRNKITKFDDWVRMDLEYIDNWSLILDLKILFKTIPAVLSGKGAS